MGTGRSEHSVTFVFAKVFQLDSCTEDSSQDSLLLDSVYQPLQARCGFDTLLHVLYKQKAWEKPYGPLYSLNLARAQVVRSEILIAFEHAVRQGLETKLGWMRVLRVAPRAADKRNVQTTIDSPSTLLRLGTAFDSVALSGVNGKSCYNIACSPCSFSVTCRQFVLHFAPHSRNKFYIVAYCFSSFDLSVVEARDCLERLLSTLKKKHVPRASELDIPLKENCACPKPLLSNLKKKHEPTHHHSEEESQVPLRKQRSEPLEHNQSAIQPNLHSEERQHEYSQQQMHHMYAQQHMQRISKHQMYAEQQGNFSSSICMPFKKWMNKNNSMCCNKSMRNKSMRCAACQLMIII